MSEHQATKSRYGASHATYLSYSVGFVLSIAFTFAAYSAVVNHWLLGKGLVFLVTGFAVLQLLVQLLFFLHLNHERRPRWNLMAFLFAGMVVLIVVIGSLWIMYNLNYNMTDQSPQQIDQSIMDDEGIHR